MKTAIYLYFKTNQKEKFEKQRSLLYSYIDSDRELSSGPVQEYVDEAPEHSADESFDRPGFRALIEDAKKGEIQTVLVTEKSVLHPDSAVADQYIQQIFPILHVRFLSVLDKYNSQKIPNTRNSISNDRKESWFQQINPDDIRTSIYGNNLSRKMRSARKEKRENGTAVSNFAPFGYVKDPEHPGKWRIDPEAGKIVRRIFDLAMEGWTTTQIAHHLNERGIPTPMVYNQTHGNWTEHTLVTAESERLWTPGNIVSYLKRYEYTGAVVMGKSRTLTAGSGITRKQPEKSWTVKEGVNEGIVTAEEFELAQQAIRNRTTPAYLKSRSYPLKGKVRCGNCRRCFHYEDSGSEPYFICTRKSASGVKSSCTGEKYPEEELNKTVLTELKKYLKESDKYGKDNIPAEIKELCTEVETSTELTKKTADTFIENIYVYDSKNIEIHFLQEKRGK